MTAADADARDAFDALSDDREWSLGFLERVDDDDGDARGDALKRWRFPSKAGGAPAWIDPVRVPFDEELRTANGDAMMFLLQVYAPEGDARASGFHRAVYVFVDGTRGGETHRAGGARAYRGQLPRENAYYDRDPVPVGERGRGLTVEERAVRRTRCDWWDEDEEGTGTGTKTKTKTKTYPEYELVVEMEAQCVDDAMAGMKLVDEDAGGDVTAEEMDAIEAAVVDADMEQLATFHVMLKNDPEQVLRYCPEPGAKPLWPSVTQAPNTDDIPHCERCGAPRKFEFQILPTIISQLGVDAENDSALDFGSMAVYTCSNSCAPVPCDETGRHTGAYAEEYVLVHPPLNQ